MMSDYQNSKIYKIIDLETEKCYIGSTYKTLDERLKKHLSNYREYLNGKARFVSSFDIIENDDYDILLIENYPCTNKKELLIRERYWANKIDCINKVKNQGLYLELGGKKEYMNKYYNQKYQLEHKEEIQKYKKEYREKNQEKIKKQNSKTFECSCGSICRYNDKARHERSQKHQKFIER